MIDVTPNKVVDELRRRYDIHPLLFQRSVEYAATPGELFDILESIPEYPIVWDVDDRRWKQVDDLSLFDRLGK
jgi:hypothetical protein